MGEGNLSEGGDCGDTQGMRALRRGCSDGEREECAVSSVRPQAGGVNCGVETASKAGAAREDAGACEAGDALGPSGRDGECSGG